MAKRRKVSNLLALAVLTSLFERPMHPYEMASVLRERGKDQAIDIKWGSLYTVVQNLEKHHFVEATGTTREGRRPERTVYSITESGRAEAADWLRELIGVPEREYPRFEAALGEMGVLPPDEVVKLLERRLGAIDAEVVSQRAALRDISQEIPRIFLIEAEYHLAMRQAEADWIRSLLKEITEDTLPGVAEWRLFHETGHMPTGFAELAMRGSQRSEEDSPEK